MNTIYLNDISESDHQRLNDAAPPSPMEIARKWLNDHSIRFSEPSPYQIKIGSINFYPGKGTIFLDSHPKSLPEKGLSGLRSVLVKEGYNL